MNGAWGKLGEPPPRIIPQGEWEEPKLETFFREAIKFHGGACLLKLHQMVVRTLISSIEAWQDVKGGGLDLEVMVAWREHNARGVAHNLW